MSFATFYDPDLGTPAPGARFSLTGAEARHAVSVRRIRVGESVEIVDGRGGRMRGQVRSADKSALEIQVEHLRREEPPAARILLVQALAKGGRDEAAIEAATEVGVNGVIAWESARSVSQWRGEKSAKGLARWEGILTSAMKQSRRAYLPELRGFARGEQVTDLLPAGAGVLILHEAATTPLTAAELPETGTIAVVVGPEGGLTDGELEMFARIPGAQQVLLGREVVRTSTAGPAALAVLNARLGRW